ncbi:MAG: hypothetical protein ACMUJM_17030 [bacterium]
MIQKRKRKELYDKFRQGAIPTGADFADFIRSQLNLLDDGIDISEDEDDPVCFRAHGEEENILDFSDKDGRKRWRITGRSEEGTKEGLNIKADNKSKLYVERETGNVGINTDEPEAKIHIKQTSATDALRVDDEGNDETPFIITSDGKVGIGIGHGDERPAAKLHINSSGGGDALRVDDVSEDTTPFIIDDKGNVGIGYDEPKAELTVQGGVAIGDNRNPGSNNLYVEGDLEVGGSVVFSNGEGVGGIEINAPLTSKTEDLTIKDNLNVIADPNQEGSDGNLQVQGDTTLGTYNPSPEHYNVVSINGRVRSGGNPDLGEEQHELEINEILTVNRDPNSPRVDVKGDLTVLGTNTLGNNEGNDHIYLNGTVQRAGSADVTIDDNVVIGDPNQNRDLNVYGTATLGNSTSDYVNLNGTVRSTIGSVNISDSVSISSDLTVKGNLRLDDGGQPVSHIVTTVNDNDNSSIPTEGAIKQYVDSQIANLDAKIPHPSYYCDNRLYYANQGWSGGRIWNGYDSYVDVYPPAGYTMAHLRCFSVSPCRIYFAGGVDGNDTLACYGIKYHDRVRCWVGNSEQRAYGIVAFYGLWIK